MGALGLLRQRLPYEVNTTWCALRLARYKATGGATGSIGRKPKGTQFDRQELDVGRLMLSGCSSKEIARKLETSIETVKVQETHVQQAGIKSQSELLIFLQAQNA